MAARRITKSAVNWTAFARRIPDSEKELLKALKGRSDLFAHRVHELPKDLPKIDFAFYKSRLTTPALADKFGKDYASLKVPYPADKDNVAAKVDQETASLTKQVETANKNLHDHVKLSKEFLAAIDKYLPDPLTSAPDELVEYFPHEKPDHERPVRWPYTPQAQPGMVPNEVR